MLFYELLGGALFMTVFSPVYLYFSPVSTILPVGFDWYWLVILAFFCTVLLYLIHISVLKTLSAFTVSLTGNLEPIYGILFAILFFLGFIKNLNGIDNNLCRIVKSQLAAVNTEIIILCRTPFFICVIIIIAGSALVGFYNNILCLFV